MLILITMYYRISETYNVIIDVLAVVLHQILKKNKQEKKKLDFKPG